MAETVNMPKLGFDMAEGTLVRWVKVEGEKVTKGDVLAEIETDKATVEVEAPYTGMVLRELVEQSAVVPVGAPIAVIGEPGEKVEIPGDGAALAPTQEKVEEKAAAPVKAGAAEPAGRAETQGAAPAGEVHASPLARRMAAERGLDLTRIDGSGPGGRIVRKDIEAFLSVAPAAAAPVAAPPAPTAAREAPALAPLPSLWEPGEIIPDEEVPLGKLRAAIGRRMAESKQQLPHFYVTRSYDVEQLVSLRAEVNANLPEDEKITINDFIVKAVGLTLRQFPNVNASLAGDKIHRHGHVNVGIAVPVEGGLLTIVTKDTDRKPLRLLSAEIRGMIKRAKAGKVRPDDIEGSTLSVSNLGMYGVDEFIAIINPPEAAILAVGAAQKVPVVDEKSGEIKVGTRMKATISADHRVVDGAEAGRFMQALAESLEHPLRLLL